MGKFFSVFLLLCALFSCAPKLSLVPKGGEEENPSFLLERAAFLPEWMEGRCQIQLESQNMNLSGQAIVRVRKDSALWISVRKLGFEVGRALVLQDSFFYLDRLNNRFQSFPLSYVREKYQLPADFFYLQALLMGNAPLKDLALLTNLKKESNLWQWEHRSSEETISLDWDIVHKRISSIDWNRPQEDKYLKMKLSEYKALESKQQFSYFRDLNIQSAEIGNIHVSLFFQQVQCNLPVSLQFDIPQRYLEGH
jgi:hypothetical protein